MRFEARLAACALHVDTLNDLVNLLGGTSATGEVLGASPQQVQAWWRRGYIASKHLLRHQDCLRSNGIVADVRLWFGRDSEDEEQEAEAQAAAE